MIYIIVIQDHRFNIIAVFHPFCKYYIHGPLFCSMFTQISKCYEPQVIFPSFKTPFPAESRCQFCILNTSSEQQFCGMPSRNPKNNYLSREFCLPFPVSEASLMGLKLKGKLPPVRDVRVIGEVVAQWGMRTSQGTS